MATRKPLRIASATAVHHPSIKKLIRTVRINPMGLDWRHFVVALDKHGELVGCGQVKPHRDGSFELASIAVVYSWRKQGVARAIIQQLLAAHTPPLWLTCISTLVPFYAQFGFRETKDLSEMPRYFRRVSRLFRLFMRRRHSPEYLAVMVYDN
jgi:N-acetylglutamate synthase-like GNAT family acetyltransferase